MQEQLIRTTIVRTVGVVGLAGIALVFLYLGLIAGTLAAAVLLVRRDDPRAWATGARRSGWRRPSSRARSSR
jgi:hypothetical protein